MNTPILRKVVIPAAGRGTRLEPITRVIPKELLPIGTLPMMAYGCTEAVEAGLTEIAVIISPGKDLVRTYLEREFLPGLPERQRRSTRLTFLLQEEPLGMADAVDRARTFVGDEPFALIIPDQLVFGQPAAMVQLVEAFQRNPTHILALFQVETATAPLYGDTGRVVYHIEESGTVRLTAMEPKGEGSISADEAGNYRALGRVILLPSFFKYLDRCREDHREGEFDDGPIFNLLLSNEVAYGHPVSGHFFDVGHLPGYLAAQSYIQAVIGERGGIDP